MRAARTLALVAGVGVGVLGICSTVSAKPDKPPKPKPKLELLTETQEAVLRKETVKIGIRSKRGDAVRARATLVVEAFPEDYRFRLGPESRPLRNRRAKVRLDLSPRQHEVLAFAQQACDEATLSLEARAARRTGTLQAQLRSKHC